MSQKTHWCFTSFADNPTFLTFTDDKPSSIRYIVWQREQCPHSGRLHWQGYVEFGRSQRMSAVKRILGDSAMHLEGRRGSRDNAREYCTKEESRVQGTSFTEVGEWIESKQGKRTDLEAACEIVRNKKGLAEVANELPTVYVKFSKGLEKLNYILNKSPNWRNIRAFSLVGTAGTGKTRLARSYFGECFLLPPPTANRVWWDGYQGEKTLVLDEFYGWLKYSYLLRILDGHPCQLEVKGGFCWALWETVVLTSNKHPSEWYEAGLTPALARRLTQTIILTDPLVFDENNNLISNIHINLN